MIPTIGRIVHYHHREDAQDWPALVLDVKADVVAGGDAGDKDLHADLHAQAKDVKGVGGGDAVHDDPSGGVHYSCLLQIFRARANEWKWVDEGTNVGQWSWPSTVFENNLAKKLAGLAALEKP